MHEKRPGSFYVLAAFFIVFMLVLPISRHHDRL